MTTAADLWHNHSTRTDRCLVHGTAVALNGWGALLLGPSGVGKSHLALQLMAMGCVLISDDRVWVHPVDAGLTLTTPNAVAGLIEMWGMGILKVPHMPSVPLSFAVDMSKDGETRCPVLQKYYIFNHSVICVPAPPPDRRATQLYHLLNHGPSALITR
ncbi:MAG: serine kinase [Pseudomonadota bacterium]